MTLLLVLGLFLLVGAALFSLLAGSTDIGLGRLWAAVWGGSKTDPAARILRYVRLPRTLGSLLCGGALAMAGAVTQGVLGNRLASPAVIGVNAGAGLAVTLCASLGVFGGFRLSLCAFCGALLAVLLVSLGASKWGASRGTVILMGVALNALFGAISDMIITFSPELAIQNAEFKVGDFSSVTDQKLIPATVMILVAGGILLTLSCQLDVLSLGEESAMSLGMNTGAMRVVFLLLAALLAGAAVSLAGLLSFVGLLVPHAVRRMLGGTRGLLPLCALFGAGFVTLCDTLSRTLFAPYEVPVGILMALLGAPCFLWILLRRKGGEGHA